MKIRTHENRRVPHPAFRRTRRMHPAYYKTFAFVSWNAGNEDMRGRALKNLNSGEYYRDRLDRGCLYPAPRRGGSYVSCAGQPVHTLVVHLRGPLSKLPKPDPSAWPPPPTS